MVVAGYLRRRIARHRLVPQHDAGDERLRHHPPAERRGGAVVMVAGNPYPVEPAGERHQRGAHVRRQPPRPAGIMERIAEAPQPVRARRLDRVDEAGERIMAVVRRQELAVRAVPARLFEVQIGDEQRRLRHPVQRPAGQRDERLPRERNGNGHADAMGETRRWEQEA